LNSKQLLLEQYIINFASAGVTSKFSDYIKTNNPTFFNFKLEIEKLSEIIKSTNVKSAAGPDLINHYLLKLIPDIRLKKLRDIYEMILKGIFFPSLWKNYMIVLFRNRQKRISALASCILKVLEKIIKKRLERFLELEYLIPVTQYGFRKEKSCEDYIALFNLKIYKAFVKRDCECFILGYKGSDMIM